MRRLLPLAALVLAAAGCGGSQTAPPAPSTSAPAPTTTAAPSGTTTLGVYFLRDGRVAPVRVEVPATRAVATAAVHALLDGPPAGYETAVPADARLESLSIADGVATATLSGELDPAAQAQLVYTLTRFPTVTGVRTLPAPLPHEPATRADYEEQTPVLLVDSPLPGEQVASPVRVSGTANAFEATFQLELRAGGETLVHRTVTATSGSGVRGTYAAELPFSSAGGDATIVAWEDNMGEGPAVLHRVEVPVRLR